MASNARRRRSSTNKIDQLSTTLSQIVPNAIASQIPGVRRYSPTLRTTYFCHICFTNYSIEDGFMLTHCQHQFCAECIAQFITNKIKHGIVDIKCFHPEDVYSDADDAEHKHTAPPCAKALDVGDIRQLVDNDTWNKYQKFKSNLSDTLSRQCPYCDWTQIGDRDSPIIHCANLTCGRLYCLYHSNAHDAEMLCEEYELSIAKEIKMNEAAIRELGDDVKPCPQCAFRIYKTGGCNHMRCVKCNCSFCWLCLEIIEDGLVPNHYVSETSNCRGKQFSGMEDEMLIIPPWLACLVIACLFVFSVPSALLGLVCAAICFPFIWCRNRTRNDRYREDLATDETTDIFVPTFVWCTSVFMGTFVTLILFLPYMLCCSLWNLLFLLYAMLRLCMPCLPRGRTPELERMEVDLERDQRARDPSIPSSMNVDMRN